MRTRVFRATAGAIAGTEDAAGVLRAAGFGKPIAVIPQFGADPRRFAFDAGARARTRSLLGIADDAYVVGYGGRLLREKGVHLLVEAAERLSGLHVLVIGSGPERAALERRARAGRAADRVIFVGAAASTDMPAWISSIDALALPSLRTAGWVEQFGRILIEAMLCGVPVVGSTSGEIPRVIDTAGLVVAEGDVGALADALERLRDPATRATFGALGRARALERFTQQRVARETIAFYERVLGESRAA
jgi:glycosyltransferase involved in cell wall biosynthesis